MFDLLFRWLSPHRVQEQALEAQRKIMEHNERKALEAQRVAPLIGDDAYGPRTDLKAYYGKSPAADAMDSVRDMYKEAAKNVYRIPEKPQRTNPLIERFDANPQHFLSDLADLMETRHITMYGFNLAPVALRKLRRAIQQKLRQNPEDLQK